MRSMRQVVVEVAEPRAMLRWSSISSLMALVPPLLDEPPWVSRRVFN